MFLGRSLCNLRGCSPQRLPVASGVMRLKSTSGLWFWVFELLRCVLYIFHVACSGLCGLDFWDVLSALVLILARMGIWPRVRHGSLFLRWWTLFRCRPRKRALRHLSRKNGTCSETIYNIYIYIYACMYLLYTRAFFCLQVCHQANHTMLRGSSSLASSFTRP